MAPLPRVVPRATIVSELPARIPLEAGFTLTGLGLTATTKAARNSCLVPVSGPFRSLGDQEAVPEDDE